MSSATVNAFDSIKYAMSKKSEPVFNDAGVVLTDLGNSTLLSQGSPDPFDMNNFERMQTGPKLTPSGWVFEIKKVPQSTTDQWEQEYKDLCKSYGMTEPYPKHSNPWIYSANGCYSQHQFRIDIYKPGRIVSKCTLPAAGNASVWLYQSENKNDFNNPYRDVIDVWTGPREYYWEIDTEETFSACCGMQRIGFSGHFGTQAQRGMETQSLVSKFSGWHYPEVRWDGNDNWEWWLDGVQMYRTQWIPSPKNVGKIYPYLILGFAPMELLPAGMDSSSWLVEYVKISSVIKI